MNRYEVVCPDVGPRIIDAETAEVSQHTLIFKDGSGAVVAAFVPPAWLRFELVGAKVTLGVVGAIGSNGPMGQKQPGYVSPITT